MSQASDIVDRPSTSKRVYRAVCIACRSKVSGRKAPCNRPVEGHGCTGCKQYGLPCIFGGIPLPPYPGPTRAPILLPCDECTRLGLRCDFKRPCDRCHNSQTICMGSTRYCFLRGVPGDDMYGYYLNIGYGPKGVNQILHSPMFAWTMPADYHLQYVRWKNEGIMSNDVVDIQRDRQLETQYVQILELAQEAAKQGVPANLSGIMEVLNREVKNGVPLNESQTARDLMYYLGKQTANNPGIHERSIEISEFNILYNEADLQKLNPGTQAEYSYIAPIRDTTVGPITRPASPGPARPNYWIPWNTKSADMIVYDNTSEYPEGRPERINMSAIRRDPFREHPNENAQSVLSAIPFFRMWNEGEMYPTEKLCQQAYAIDGMCERPTRRGCEDTTHVGYGIPICDTCEGENRERFYEEFANVALQMRQYLCHQCSSGIDPLLYITTNTGCDLYYGNPMGIPMPDFTSSSLVSTGLTKKHLLDLQEAISDMRIYIDSLYGKMVCPVCKFWPGINDYNFQGPLGGEGALKTWICLACHGIVITENTTALIPRHYLKSGAPTPAPAPYGIRVEELEVANNKLQQLHMDEMQHSH
ncbi:hypothetical protein F4814DRAFT_456706 [Daldinia grandis]|nr:hypothetical protein F4814DRAFT_456706 [Daldinia grandis]